MGTSGKIFDISIFSKTDDILLPPNREPNYTRRNFYKVTLIPGENKVYYADNCKDVNGTALIFTDPNVPYF